MTLRAAMAGVALFFMPWGSASAQGLGTFRWQLAPHCNIITVEVERRGSRYDLVGSDDRCHLGEPAILQGVAVHANQQLVTMSVTIRTLDGASTGLSMTILVSPLSGTWSDEYGNRGDAQFNPALPAGGMPRAVTYRGSFATRFTAGQALESGVAAFSFPRYLAVAMPGLQEDVRPPGSGPTASCPGSASDPQAAPGHLCVYESARTNALSVCVGAGSGCGLTDRSGAAVHVTAATPGAVLSAGTWALTPVP